jgi:WD40 repeat protein
MSGFRSGIALILLLAPFVWGQQLSFSIEPASSSSGSNSPISSLAFSLSTLYWGNEAGEVGWMKLGAQDQNRFSAGAKTIVQILPCLSKGTAYAVHGDGAISEIISSGLVGRGRTELKPVAAAISKNESYLVVGDKKGRLKVYSLPGLALSGSLPAISDEALIYLDFRNNGELIGVSAKNEVGVWDVARNRLLKSVKLEGKESYSAKLDTCTNSLMLGVATQGKLTLTNVQAPVVETSGFTGSTDKTPTVTGGSRPSSIGYGGDWRDYMLLFDLQQSTSMKAIESPAMRQIRTLSFSSDSRYVGFATKGGDSGPKLRVMDVRRGDVAFEMEGPAPIRKVEFSPDGQWVAAGRDNGQVSLYRTQGIYPEFGCLSEYMQSLPYQITSEKTPLLRQTAATDTFAFLDLQAQNCDTSIASTVSQLLQSRLTSSTRKARWVERGQLDKVLTEIQMQMSGITDSAGATQLGKMLNANKMFFGTVSKLGQTLTITVKVVNVETAEVVGMRELLYKQPTLDDLPEALMFLARSLIQESL